MKLTSFTDFSLRVLMYLGLQDQRMATIAEMADAFGISGHHLTKVVHFLGKTGLLRNVRGKGGGVTLARPAGAIRLGDDVHQLPPIVLVGDFGIARGQRRFRFRAAIWPIVGPRHMDGRTERQLALARRCCSARGSSGNRSRHSWNL